MSFVLQRVVYVGQTFAMLSATPLTCTEESMNAFECRLDSRMSQAPSKRYIDGCIANGVDNFWCEPHLVVWTTLGVHHS